MRSLPYCAGGQRKQRSPLDVGLGRTWRSFHLYPAGRRCYRMLPANKLQIKMGSPVTPSLAPGGSMCLASGRVLLSAHALAASPIKGVTGAPSLAPGGSVCLLASGRTAMLPSAHALCCATPQKGRHRCRPAQTQSVARDWTRESGRSATLHPYSLVPAARSVASSSFYASALVLEVGHTGAPIPFILFVCRVAT